MESPLLDKSLDFATKIVAGVFFVLGLAAVILFKLMK